jgi:protein phosphatase-4 regulatory subunit 3
MLLVDHDTSGIRSFILQENKTKSTDAANKGGKKTLLYLLIDTFHKEEDLGVKAQLSEAIRVLLLPPGDTPATEVSGSLTPTLA